MIEDRNGSIDAYVEHALGIDADLRAGSRRGWPASPAAPGPAGLFGLTSG